jgi:putative transcriptional regulator
MKKESKIEWDYRNEINKPLKSGSLLLSEPFMLDPSFNRSACLVVSHDKKEGTFGFILNKDSGETLSSLLETDIDWPVFYGGPVETRALFFIHNNSFDLKDAIEIKKGLFWHGNFEELISKIEKGEVKKNDIRFFMGYSGWDGGQLRREIIENSWIISNSEKNNIFASPENIWTNALKEMGGIYKEFANFPTDPSLN